MRNLFVFTLLLLGIAGFVSSETCPSDEDINPCTCEEEDENIIISCYEEDTTFEQLKNALKKLTGKKNIHLVLDSIKLGTVPANFFSGLDVKLLDISHCELENLSDTNDILPPLSGLEDSLEELVILSSFREENGATKLTLGHLRKLKEVDLSFNAITEISNDWFANPPPSLERLSISNNGIEKIGDRAFIKLSNVKALSLDGNRFGPISRNMLPNPATQLTKLELDNNDLDTIPEDLFNNMPSLRSLSLRTNKIRILEQRTWETIWQQMEYIRLEGNPVACDSSLNWAFNVRTSAAVFGKCDSPEEKSGMSLHQFIKNKGQ